MNKPQRIPSLIAIFGMLPLWLAVSEAGEEVSFNLDVRPILSDRCFACHGFDANKREGDLRLDQSDGKEGAYRTHKGSTAVVPGSLEKSALWQRIISTDEEEVMPPPDSHKKVLSQSEQEIIKSWILQGAKYEKFWAFVSPEAPKTPEVKKSDWSDQTIDFHILHRLEKAGIKPSPEADKRTLIRRLSFDLTGLPPTLEQVKAFVTDTRPNAYELLVDDLMARPGYGEHMTRYWLDLVRFADTNGMHKDFYRNNFAYRDWVIRSFNNNLGYNDFLRYQLAGDLIPNGGNDALVASGFNRLHLIIDKGTALPEESHFKNVLDRVTAVGTAFMGLTVQCAQCHDHKYDPITQKDFYSLYAFFNNIDVPPETRGRERDGLQAPFIVMASPQEKQKLADFDLQIAALTKEVNAAKAAAAKTKEPAEKAALAKKTKDAEAKLGGVRKQRSDLDRTIVKAMVSKEREKIQPAFIMNRGEYDAPGKQVQRGTPDFLPPLKKAGKVASRLDLAEWFVDPKHPLTARVGVNRFWQQFFGVGLVKTSEDLGTQGEVPSHPELLDHLAVSFVKSGWDVKALVKQIVMSKTYQQSSVATPKQFKKDQENRLLSRGSRFRMDAEMIRDQILVTSGLLSNDMYGRSVKPPQPDGLWRAVSMIGETFKPDTGDSIHRRSVYTFWKRAIPPPQMTILNSPIRDSCISRRERTNTSTQALLLLNETEYMKAARRLAAQALANKKLSDQARLDFIYETVTSKLPDDVERKALMKLLKDLEATYQANGALAEKLCEGLELPDSGAKAKLSSWTVLVNTLYNLDITKTRE